MYIYIETFTGRKIMLDVQPNDTIEEVKEKLRENEGFYFNFFFFLLEKSLIIL